MSTLKKTKLLKTLTRWKTINNWISYIVTLGMFLIDWKMAICIFVIMNQDNLDTYLKEKIEEIK